MLLITGLIIQHYNTGYLSEQIKYSLMESEQTLNLQHFPISLHNQNKDNREKLSNAAAVVVFISTLKAV